MDLGMLLNCCLPEKIVLEDFDYDEPDDSGDEDGGIFWSGNGGLVPRKYYRYEVCNFYPTAEGVLTVQIREE